MNNDPSLRWIRIWKVPEIGHPCKLGLDERLVVPLAQGIAVINSRLAGVIAEDDGRVGPGVAVLKVGSVVSENVPMDLGARRVASVVIRGEDGFANGVEVGGVVGNAGSGGAGHVDSRQDVQEASSDEGHGSGEHRDELHSVKIKSVFVKLEAL